MFPYSEKLEVGVRASNTAGAGPVLRQIVTFPPKTPKFLNNPIITRVGNTSISVQIPPPIDLTSKRYVISTKTLWF